MPRKRNIYGYVYVDARQWVVSVVYGKVGFLWTTQRRPGYRLSVEVTTSNPSRAPREAGARETVPGRI